MTSTGFDFVRALHASHDEERRNGVWTIPAWRTIYATSEMITLAFLERETLDGYGGDDDDDATG